MEWMSGLEHHEETGRGLVSIKEIRLMKSNWINVGENSGPSWQKVSAVRKPWLQHAV